MCYGVFIEDGAPVVSICIAFITQDFTRTSATSIDVMVTGVYILYTFKFLHAITWRLVDVYEGK